MGAVVGADGPLGADGTIALGTKGAEGAVAADAGADGAPGADGALALGAMGAMGVERGDSLY
jgi:hypothetical protein